MSAIVASANPTVDGLVEAITVKLRLTEAQERLALERAAGVTDWLRAWDSPLARYFPEIFPQGSMRHSTTVRPKNQVEYDLDLVCLLHVPAGDPISPDELYELVYARLAAHPAYSKILERKNRCVRLSYAGDFHLDILPARPDFRRGGTCLLVPDRALACWKPSNPSGFAEWFDLQATQGSRVVARYAGTFMTTTLRTHLLATLRRVVQLMKRRRDIVFDGDQYCARSVVLTTLAAADYDGETLCTDAIVSTLNAIIVAFDGLVDPPPVPNPTNRAENFADKWTRATFADFMAFIHQFRSEMEDLLALHDLEEVHAKLKEMFGEAIATEVVREAAQRIRAIKDDGLLRFAGPAVSLTATPVSHSRTIPGNTFHGQAL